MKVKTKDIINSTQSLNEILSLGNLPIKYAFTFSVNTKQINEKIETYNKLKNDLIMKLGEKIKDTKDSYTVKQENIEQYNSEINSLLENEIEVTIDKINKEEFKEFSKL